MNPVVGKTIKFDDVLMYLAIGRKHARLIVLLFCFSMLAGLVLYTFTRPVYYARSNVRYQTIERSADADRIFEYSSDHAVILQLGSPHIIERAAKKLGVVASSREIQLKYLKKLSVKFDSENNIEIEVWAYNYPWARDFAEALVKEYLLYRDEKRIEQSEAVLKSFSGEMDQMRQKMDDVLSKRQDFDETNAMTELMIELNNLKEIPEEIAVAEHHIAIMDRTRETLQDTNLDTVARLSLLTPPDDDVELSLGQVVPNQNATEGGSNVVVVPSLVASSTKAWEELDKQKRALEISIQELGQKLLPGNVKMMALQKQLDAANVSLETELDAAQNRFDVEYASLKDQLRQLKLKLPDYEEINRRHERMLQNFNNFDSGQLAWQSLYSDMARKITAWDFSADKERAQLQYMGHIEISDEPVSPRLIKIFLCSIGMAVALGVGVPSLIEFLDNSVSDLEKAEESLNIRGMGVVPRIADEQMEEPLLFNMNAKSGHHLKEIFRTIRTNLTLNTAQAAPPQVILVTSAMPQEGKTLVSSNLALSFAQNGEKTLLIDCDLRRGRMHRLFACENRPGLSEMLSERKTLEESCHQSFHENLTVLTCGRHISDGAELLTAMDFTKLVQDLRQKYQRVILDTPPVLGLSETSILQGFADGVLMVIWSGHTPLPTVRAAVDVLQSNGSKFFGFVLNRLDFSATANSYKYFYYSYNYYENYQIAEKV